MANDIIEAPAFNLEELKSHIYIVRGKQVMLDRDLAELYGVETKRLNEAVKRNIGRFPEDFMFRINEMEWDGLTKQMVIPIDNMRSQIATSYSQNAGMSNNMRSQIVTAYPQRRNKSAFPYVFTELGVAMLSSVLRSETAIQVNINIMRAFVEIRHAMVAMQDNNLRMEQLAHKVDQMDASITEILHEQGDMRREQEEANAEMALQIEALNDALDQLRDTPKPERNRIGFKTHQE
ncbi:MAG: ORF6N domain-containing protein [Bacteroidales bacterium]|nr:ORF6N domain-containing protein [Bacteroidales bacterium]